MIFGREARGLPYIKGNLVTTLNLICKRCNAAVSHAINVPLRLSPVSDDSQAVKLPEAYEPVIMQAGQLTLADVVEEELLLNVPTFPHHRTGECPADIVAILNE